MVATREDKKDDKKKGKVKTKDLKLNKETVEELTESELDGVQGGTGTLAVRPYCATEGCP
jgi:hypothetical protein